MQLMKNRRVFDITTKIMCYSVAATISCRKYVTVARGSTLLLWLAATGKAHQALPIEFMSLVLEQINIYFPGLERGNMGKR